MNPFPGPLSSKLLPYYQALHKYRHYYPKHHNIQLAVCAMITNRSHHYALLLNDLYIVHIPINTALDTQAE